MWYPLGGWTPECGTRTLKNEYNISILDIPNWFSNGRHNKVLHFEKKKYTGHETMWEMCNESK